MPWRKWWRVIWFVVLAHSAIHAQKYAFRTYTTADGLLPFAAERMLQDRLGNIWFTAAGGLTMYNGKVFRTFTTDEGLGDNACRALVEDDHGNIWIGTLGGGLSRVRRHELGEYDVRTYTTADGLPHNAVLSVAKAPDGAVWIGTKNGVARLDVDTLGVVRDVKASLPGTTFDRILLRRDGTALFGDTHGVLHWSGGVLSGSQRIFPENAAGINGLAEDSQGRIWISAFRGGVKRLRWNNGRFSEEAIPTLPALQSPVYDLSIDVRDRVWISTFGQGLSGLDGPSVRRYDQSNGLPEASVVTAFVDREDNLWISTANSGLCKWVNSPFLFFDRATGLSGNFVLDVLQDRTGKYWFTCYEAGAVRYDGRLFQSVADRDGLSARNVYALMEDSRGRVWVSTMGNGVYVNENGRFKPFFKGHTLLTDVLVMFEDRAKNIWFGTDAFGVVRYSPQGQWTQFGTDQGLAGQRVFSIMQDRRGRIWFGCGQPTRMKEAGGVSYWDPERDLKNLNPFITYSATRDFPSNLVNVVYQDRQGMIWAGTRHHGLLQFDGASWTAFTKKDGLVSNTVMALQEDSLGRLWIGTTKGVNLWDGRHMATFTTRHGLINDEVYENAIWCDRRGDIWLGTAGGVCQVQVRKLTAAQSPPMVYADRIRAGGTAVSEAALAGLSHRQNSLDFQVTGIQWSAEKDLLYRFRLEGFDTDWPEPTTRDFVSYTNLEPGRYVLAVQALSRTTGASSAVLNIPFVINPAYWQTWWFRLVALVVAFVTIPIAYRYVRRSYDQFQQWRRTRVIAHYRIREFLGEGGMGRVYKAWDTRRRQVVALKVIRDDLEQSSDGVKRFLKEAEIGQSLNHPNIIRVFDAGRFEKTRYLAMEYVEGITLKTYLAQRGKVELKEALTIAQQILSGLQTIHAQFVIHRDLKSDNIMLEKDGVVKIMDFGLAKSRMLSSIMDRGQLVGTLAYMSPEQTIGKSVDHRSDIYAVGVILYEMVYGEMPFTGQHEMELIMAIHNTTPPHVDSPYLDGVERVIAKALQKDVQARYQNALEMLGDLDALDKALEKKPTPGKK